MLASLNFSFIHHAFADEANAGSDLYAFVPPLEITVSLQGSGSCTSGNQPDQYSWTQISGPVVTLNNPSQSIASFSPTQIPSGSTFLPRDELVFLLSVSCNAAVTVDQVSVFVVNTQEQNLPPLCYPPDYNIQSLCTSASTSCAEGTTLDYRLAIPEISTSHWTEPPPPLPQPQNTTKSNYMDYIWSRYSTQSPWRHETSGRGSDFDTLPPDPTDKYYYSYAREDAFFHKACTHHGLTHSACNVAGQPFLFGHSHLEWAERFLQGNQDYLTVGSGKYTYSTFYPDVYISEAIRWLGNEADQNLMKQYLLTLDQFEGPNQYGAHQRSFAHAINRKTVSLRSDIPQDELRNSYSDQTWHDWWVPGDTSDNSSNYMPIAWQYLAQWLDLTGGENLYQDPKIKNRARQLIAQMSPLGTLASYGDTVGLNSTIGEYIAAFEKLATIYQSGDFKWSAHRAFEWANRHNDMICEWGGLPLNISSGLMNAWLNADDSLPETVPTFGSLVTYRYALTKQNFMHSGYNTPPYDDYSVLMKPGLAPDKLILRSKTNDSSGWNQEDMFALVELTPAGGHGHADPASINFMTAQGSALLYDTSYLVRDHRYHNTFLAVTPTQPYEFLDFRLLDDMAITVPQMNDSPFATYAHVNINQYMGRAGSVHNRKFFFIKNKFIWVQDQFESSAALTADFGPAFQTLGIYGVGGENWVNTAQTSLPAANIWDLTYLLQWPNRPWDLLVKFFPDNGASLQIDNVKYDDSHLILPDRSFLNNQRFRLWYKTNTTVSSGQTLKFNSLLVPNAPNPDRSELANSFQMVFSAPQANILRLEDTENPGTTYYFGINESGTTITSDPISTDARQFMVRLDQGALVDYWISGGLTFTLNQTNIDHLAQDDVFNMNENSSPQSLDVLANDDPLAQTLIHSVVEPSQGTLTISPDQKSLIYTPPLNFYGEVTFSYTTFHDNTRYTSATVRIIVNNIPGAPDAVDDLYTLPRFSSLPIENFPIDDIAQRDLDVLTNDSQPEPGDPTARIISVSPATYGPTSIVENGTKIRYVRPVNFAGQDTFSYTIQNQGGTTDTANVVVILRHTDQPPYFETIAGTNVVGSTTPVQIQSHVGEPIQFNVVARDPNPDQVTIMHGFREPLPQGAQYTNNEGNPATNTFSWTPTEEQASLIDSNTGERIPYKLTVGTWDDKEPAYASMVASYPIEIVVLPAIASNSAPVISEIYGEDVTDGAPNPVIISGAEGELISFGVVATDTDAQDTIHLSLTGNVPQNFAFVPTDGNPATGTFTWMPDFSSAGTYDAVVIANDSDLSSSYPVQIVVADQDPGQVDTDGDGTPDVWENSYSCMDFQTPDSNSDYDTDLLININEYTHNTNPCDADSDNDGYTDGREVNDGSDPNDSNSLPPNQAPIWDNSVPILFDLNELTPFTLQLPFATDPDLGDTVTYTLLGKPSFANFDAETHLFTWTPSYGSKNQSTDSIGPNDGRIHLKAIDSHNAERTLTVSFRIQNQDRVVPQVIQHVPVVENGQLLVENEPFVPIMAGGIPLMENGIDMITRMHNLGFNSIGTLAYGIEIDRGTTCQGAQRLVCLNNVINSIQILLNQVHAFNAQPNARRMRILIMAHQPEIVQAFKNDPDVLGWELPDEPDLGFLERSDSYYSPESFQSMANQIRNQYAANETAHPIFVNLSAKFSQLLRPSDEANSEINAVYQSYVDLADAVSFDYYFQNSSLAPQAPNNHHTDKLLQGFAEELREFTQDKPVFYYLEATNYGPMNPFCNSNTYDPTCPTGASDNHVYPITPAIVRSQLRAAFEAGVSGIRYYGANYYEDNPNHAGLDAHFFELHSSLEQEFPTINSELNNGIESIQANPVPNTFPSDVTLTAVLNSSFSADEFVWEVSGDLNGVNGRKVICGGTNSPAVCSTNSLLMTVPAPGVYQIKISASNSENRTAVKFVNLIFGDSDADGDGLLDWWEIQHFGSLDFGAGDDPDHDWKTNAQEFSDGTNPTEVEGNLIQNSSFENGVDANGIPLNWIDLFSSGTKEIDAQIKHFGHKSWKWTRTQTNLDHGAYSDFIAVTTDQIYRMATFIRSETGNESFTLGWEEFDENQQNACPNDEFSCIHYFVGSHTPAPSSWTWFEGTLKPSRAQTRFIKIRFFTFSDVANRSIWWDDLSLVEVDSEYLNSFGCRNDENSRCLDFGDGDLSIPNIQFNDASMSAPLLDQEITYRNLMAQQTLQVDFDAFDVDANGLPLHPMVLEVKFKDVIDDSQYADDQYETRHRVFLSSKIDYINLDQEYIDRGFSEEREKVLLGLKGSNDQSWKYQHVGIEKNQFQLIRAINGKFTFKIQMPDLGDLDRDPGFVFPIDYISLKIISNEELELLHSRNRTYQMFDEVNQPIDAPDSFVSYPDPELTIFTRDLMKPVYHSTKPQLGEITDAISTRSAQGEIATFNFGAYSESGIQNLSASISDLVNSENGNTIASDQIKLFQIKERYVRSQRYFFENFMLMPDHLEELTSFDIEHGESKRIWVKGYVPDNAAGLYTGTIQILHNGVIRDTVNVSMQVLPLPLDHAANANPVYHDPYLKIFSEDVDEVFRVYRETGFDPFFYPAIIPITDVNRNVIGFDTDGFTSQLNEFIAKGFAKKKLVLSVYGLIPQVLEAIQADTSLPIYDRFSLAQFQAGFRLGIQTFLEIAAQYNLEFYFDLGDEPCDDAIGRIYVDRLAPLVHDAGGFTTVTYYLDCDSSFTAAPEYNVPGNILAAASNLIDYKVWVQSHQDEGYRRQNDPSNPAYYGAPERFGYYTTITSYLRNPMYNRFIHGFFATKTTAALVNAYAMGDVVADPFNDFDLRPTQRVDYDYPDFVFAYPSWNNGKLIETMALEGIRLGIQDAKYVATLKRLIAENPDHPNASIASQFLISISNRIDPNFWANYVGPNRPEGYEAQILSNLDEQHNANNFNAFGEIRDEIINLIAGFYNQAPQVNAGDDQTIIFPANAQLVGSVTDDELINPEPTLLWSKVIGPGDVTFAGENQLATSAAFSTAGNYILRLTANDGALSGFDEVRIIVQSDNTTNVDPEGTIDLPNADLTVGIGDFVSFMGSGTDSDGNLPLTYLWDFGGGTSNSTVEDPGPVVFNTAGTFNVQFTVTDSLGFPDPTPDTVTITVQATSSDSDGDGLPDWWENNYFGNLDQNGTGDSDGDLLNHLDEYLAGTDPTNFDTDGDIMSDGWEVAHQLNALNPSDAASDPDNDGLKNLEEYVANADPHQTDSDQDGVLDNTDRYPTDATNHCVDDPTEGLFRPRFHIKFSDETQRTYNTADSQCADTRHFVDDLIDATITKLPNNEWELTVQNKPGSSVSIETVNFPWQPGGYLLDTNSNDDINYSTYLMGISKRANSLRHWGWNGLPYPGTNMAPLVVIADQNKAKLVAATNWPPKAVTSSYSLGLMTQSYGEIIPPGETRQFRTMIVEVDTTNLNGVKPWQLALDSYKSWLDQHMESEGFYQGNPDGWRVAYPDWMKNIHGWADVQLENHVDLQNGQYSLVEQIDNYYGRWKSIFPWLQFWGQMSLHAGECCAPNRTLHPRYTNDAHGLSLLDYIATYKADGSHAGFYSRPLFSEIPDVDGSDHYYHLTDTNTYQDWDADNETPLQYLVNWKDIEYQQWGANSIYIDVLGAGHFGDPLAVANLFAAGNTPVFDDYAVIERVVDIYPTAFMVSGVIEGGDMEHRPGDTPENSEHTTFANFGRYILPDRIMFLGQANSDWQLWGHNPVLNDPFDPRFEHYQERQVFMLGAKFDAQNIAESYTQPDVLNHAIDATISERERVQWWNREPSYLDTKGISNVNPVGKDVRRFRDLNGQDLLVIDNWVNPVAQLSFHLDGNQIQITIPNDSVSGTPEQLYIFDVSDPDSNQAPQVNAGTDQTIALPSNVQLSGAVTDDGLPIPSNLTTDWSITSGPGTVIFSDANALSTTASFSADGVYVLRLTANDGERTSYDEIQVTVNPEPPNQLPIAHAGTDQIIEIPFDQTTVQVTLNGSLSSDLDGTISLYEWTGTPDPSDSVQPTIELGIGTHTFNLRVQDNSEGWSANVDQVTITIQQSDNPNQPPQVSAGADQTITLPSNVQLSGTVTDDGLPIPVNLTVEWSKTSGPGSVTFTDAGSPTTTATFSESGTYVLRLTASDSERTEYDEIQIVVNDDALENNQPPTVNAGPDQSVDEGALVQLLGSASDPDLPLVYTWSQVSGSVVTLSNIHVLNPTFVAPQVDQSGAVLVFRLTVEDNLQSSGFDEVIIQVRDQEEAGTPPPDDGDNGFRGDDGNGEGGSNASVFNPPFVVVTGGSNTTPESGSAVNSEALSTPSLDSGILESGASSGAQMHFGKAAELDSYVDEESRKSSEKLKKKISKDAFRLSKPTVLPPAVQESKLQSVRTPKLSLKNTDVPVIAFDLTITKTIGPISFYIYKASIVKPGGSDLVVTKWKFEGLDNKLVLPVPKGYLVYIDTPWSGSASRRIYARATAIQPNQPSVSQYVEVAMVGSSTETKNKV